MVWIYLGYFVLATIVVLLSIKLAKYVDLLDKTTNISGAFIGGIFLAAVTSLPELFTSISSVAFVKTNELVIGNILGSNLFNLMILGLAVCFFSNKFLKAKLSKSHLLTGFGTLLIYIIVGIVLFVKGVDNWMIGWFNVASIVIISIYALVVLKTPSSEENEENEESPLTKKQIITRFILCAILLIGSSIGITYLTDMIAEDLKIGATLGGAILLGIATSLPELTSTIALCAKGNFNASTGNILGSNLFNFAILFVADIFSFQGGDYNKIYYNNHEATMLLIFGGIATILLLSLLIYRINKKREDKVIDRVVSIITGILIFSCYVLFLTF